MGLTWQAEQEEAESMRKEGIRRSEEAARKRNKIQEIAAGLYTSGKHPTLELCVEEAKTIYDDLQKLV